MFPKTLLLIITLVVLGVTVALVCLAPVAAPALFRVWMNGAASEQNLEVTWSGIEAPLFRPVVLRDVKLRSKPGNPAHVAIDIAHAELDLRLAALLDSTRGRPLRHLKLENIRGEIREPTSATTPSRHGLNAVRRLLADNFTLTFQSLQIARGNAALEIHDAALSASEIEAGRFTASEVVVRAPWFRKSFADLRGATSWQYDRLALGAISLMRGLDLDAVTFDFAHLAEDRISIEANLDAFGGKVRARLATGSLAWDVAATATQVSLAQASDALDFSSRASGTLRSSKFTFRGDLGNLADSTASIWAQLDGLTWGDRSAETIMLGASLYSRQIQVEQIYVKQRDNQFTLTGESAIPRKESEWPDFRGDVSASIKNLGEFARLFGGRASAFSGEVEVVGSVTEREHKFGGQLTASGNSLTIFGAPVDSLSGKFNLKESAVSIEQCELRRGSDFATATGTLDLAAGHRYAGRIAVSIADLAPYESLLIWAGDYLYPEGSLSLEGQTDATSASGAGTFRIQGHAVRPKTSFSLLPFDAELEGSYSADQIFLQKCSLRNGHAALSTFATIADDYLQLQFLRFEVNGKLVMEGDLYLPVTTSIPAENGRWFTGIVPDSSYALDLRVPATDLGEVAGAISTQHDFTGKIDGRVQVYGTTDKPEAHLALHARDVAAGEAARLSADFEANTAANVIKVRANVSGPNFAPAQSECSVPFEFDENGGDYRILRDSPFTAALNAPGIAIAKLPSYLAAGFKDGNARAKITASGSWRHPSIEGSAELGNVRAQTDRMFSARFLFHGPTAKIDAARIAENGVAVSFSGEAEFSDTAAVALRLQPENRLRFAHSSASSACLRDIRFAGNENPAAETEPADRTDLRGPFLAPGWTLTLSDSTRPANSETTFSFCRDDSDAETLTLQVAR